MSVVPRACHAVHHNPHRHLSGRRRKFVQGLPAPDGASPRCRQSPPNTSGGSLRRLAMYAPQPHSLIHIPIAGRSKPGTDRGSHGVPT